MVNRKQIPPEDIINYKIIDKPYQDFNDFFDEYAEGKRQGNGIWSRYYGYANDVTMFWKDDEEYPFAYVFPKTITLDFRIGYFFYTNLKIN